MNSGNRSWLIACGASSHAMTIYSTKFSSRSHSSLLCRSATLLAWGIVPSCIHTYAPLHARHPLVTYVLTQRHKLTASPNLVQRSLSTSDQATTPSYRRESMWSIPPAHLQTFCLESVVQQRPYWPCRSGHMLSSLCSEAHSPDCGSGRRPHFNHRMPTCTYPALDSPTVDHGPSSSITRCR
jgi:hypothetical protein